MVDKVHVITSVERRRRLTADEKQRSVAEASGGAVVSKVARRYEISASLLFSWRKALDRGQYSPPAGLDAALSARIGALRKPRVHALQRDPAPS